MTQILPALTAIIAGTIIWYGIENGWFSLQATLAVVGALSIYAIAQSEQRFKRVFRALGSRKDDDDG